MIKKRGNGFDGVGKIILDYNFSRVLQNEKLHTIGTLKTQSQSGFQEMKKIKVNKKIQQYGGMGKNVFDDIFDNEFFKQWKQTHPDVPCRNRAKYEPFGENVGELNAEQKS